MHVRFVWFYEVYNLNMFVIMEGFCVFKHSHAFGEIDDEGFEPFHFRRLAEVKDTCKSRATFWKCRSNEAKSPTNQSTSPGVVHAPGS